MPASAQFIDRSSNIIARLAATLVQGESTDLSRIAVIFPSRRLGNYLQLELTRRVQACIPPKILTIESLAKVLPGSGQSVISTTTQHIILNAFLSERNLPSLQRGMEADLCRFYNEIAESGHDVAIFDQIEVLLQENPFFDERHIEQLLDQTKAWKQLHQKYSDFLRRHKSSDRALDQLARISRYEKTGGSNFASFADRYFIVGFGDALPLQVRLFKLLQQEVNCEFWFHCDSKTLNQTHKSPCQPLVDFIDALGLEKPAAVDKHASPHTKVARQLFAVHRTVHEPIENADLHIYQAFSPLQEVKAAVAIAQKIIRHGEANPEEIIIAVPDEETYGDLLWATCDEAGLPVNYALGIPIIRTQLGQWLRLFLDLLTNEAPLPVLLDLFNNKVVNQWFASLGREVDKNELIRHIHFIARKHNITKDLNLFLEHAEKEKFTELFFILHQLQGIAKPFALSEQNTLIEWTDILWNLTESLQLHAFVQQNPGAYNLEQRVLTRWINGLQQLASSGDMLDNKISAKNLASIILQNIMAGRVRPAGQPFVGVQVLGMLELRSLSPKVLIVLGNTEGQFPDSPGRELFYSQPLRQKLGLTTVFKYEKLLDQQFYHLLCSAPQIHFFHSSQFNEEPLVISRYLQRLALFGQNHIHSLTTETATPDLFFGDFLLAQTEYQQKDELHPDLQVLHSQVEKRLDERGNFQGERAETLAHYTYSTLKYLLHCPYRFLLSRVNIQDDVLPEGEIEPADIGVWLHEVCQLFFKGLTENSLVPEWPDLFHPWHAAISEENYDRAYDRLKRLGKVRAHKLGDHVQDLIFMEDVGWHIFLHHEIELGNYAGGENQVEIKFDRDLPEIGEETGRTCSATIRIDRIAVSEIGGFLIDYKKTIPPSKNFNEGDEPQLPLYFHFIKEHPDYTSETLWTGIYRDFKTAKPTKFDEKRLSEAWEHIKTRWKSRIAQLLKEKEAYSAEASDAACKYCQYTGICRREEHGYFAGETVMDNEE